MKICHASSAPDIFHAWRLISARRSGGRIGRLIFIASAYAVGWITLMVAPATRVRVAYYKILFHTPVMSLGNFSNRLYHVVGTLGRTTIELEIIFYGCWLLALRFTRVPPGSPRRYKVLFAELS